jgi:hypothetical protein
MAKKVAPAVRVLETAWILEVLAKVPGPRTPWISLIVALGRVMDSKFEASLGYIARLCLKTTTTTNQMSKKHTARDCHQLVPNQSLGAVHLSPCPAEPYIQRLCRETGAGFLTPQWHCDLSNSLG